MTPSNGLNSEEDLWVFGYASLVWKNSDVIHTRSEFGYVEGYVRRFWHGSPDHRGTVAAPGLVASLYSTDDLSKLGVKAPSRNELRVYGRAFLVSGSSRADVVAALDRRESNGFEQRWLPVYGADGKVLVKKALVYIAPPSHPAFAGALKPLDIVEVVAQRVGNSGTNREYLVRLAEALRERNIRDEHVEKLMKVLPPVSLNKE